VSQLWSGAPSSAVAPSAERAGGWSWKLSTSRGGPPKLTRIAVAAEVVAQAASLAAWKTYAPPWGKAWPGADTRTVMPSAETVSVFGRGFTPGVAGVGQDRRGGRGRGPGAGGGKALNGAGVPARAGPHDTGISEDRHCSIARQRDGVSEPASRIAACVRQERGR